MKLRITVLPQLKECQTDPDRVDCHPCSTWFDRHPKTAATPGFVQRLMRMEHSAMPRGRHWITTAGTLEIFEPMAVTQATALETGPITL